MSKITDTEKLAHIIYNAIGDGTIDEKSGIDFLLPILTAWRKEIVNAFYDKSIELYKRIHRNFR